VAAESLPSDHLAVPLAVLDSAALEPAAPGAGALATATAIYVYGRTTLALACAAPIRLSAFPGRAPAACFDPGSHTLTVEPGVYLVRAEQRVEVSGGDLDVVQIVGGKPARRTPRRLSQAMPSLRRRELARFLRRPAPERRLERVIRRVLVVDEDAAATRRYVRGFGPERTVLTAADAAAARMLAESAPIDLAIVELRIGGESGIALARELKRLRPEIAVALCSGYLSVEIAVAALRAGVDVALFKPATAQEILCRVGAAADGTAPEAEPETLEHAEWDHISRVLADCRGNISQAASRLGIYRSSLQRRLRRAAAQPSTRGKDGRRDGAGTEATASGSAGTASPDASSSSKPASRII
jgi:two-component system response regulator RegA